MTRRRLLVALTVAAVAVGAFVMLMGASTGDPGGPAPVMIGDPHAPVPRAPGEEGRILAAVEAVTSQQDPAALIAEGRRLFRSTALAKRGESCQGCHTEGGTNPDLGMTPHVAATPDDFVGPRDPPTLWRVARTAPYFWDAREATLTGTVLATIKNHFAGNEPGDPTTPLMEQQTAAIVAYLATLGAPDGDFQRGTMSAAALRGEELFQGKAGCIACHGGPEFTDNRAHNTFVPQVPVVQGAPSLAADDPGTSVNAPANPRAGAPAPPPGSGLPVGARCGTPPTSPPPNADVLADPLICAFNTPALLGTGRSAPFMHNGVFTTLDQVVRFYNTSSSVAPLNLTAQEIADVVAYLEAL